jgi:hypothetical protein
VFSNTLTSGPGVVVIDSAGEVGIGEVSPLYRLHVNNLTNTGPSTFLQASGTNTSLVIGKLNTNFNSGTILWNHSGGDGSISNYLGLGYWGGDNKLVVRTNGCVGIATTAPSATLHVVGNVYASNALSTGNVFATGNVFVTGNTYSSRAGIGTTTFNSLYTLNVNGTIGASQDITAFTSDERLKARTGTIENALDKVCSLDTFTYTHNDLARSFGFIDTRQYVGVSAQQVNKVLPETVRPAPFDADMVDGVEISKSGQFYMTVQYERLVPLLIEAIKDERKAREALDARIKFLELDARIKLLEQK